MSDILSNSTARRVFLHRHGFSEPANRQMEPRELESRIKQIGFVQVDSIRTVERAHHMILHARNFTYKPQQLSDLVEKDRALFENWTHDASIIPSELYPYWRPRFERVAGRLRERWRKHRRPGFEKEMSVVRAHIEREGPVMARELGNDAAKKTGGWWNWHPSKTALELLWRTGELAIARRENFQKVYDLTERVMPAVHLTGCPDKEAYVDWACSSALDHLSFAAPGEIAAYWDAVTAKEASDWCAKKLGAEVQEIEIAGAKGEKHRILFTKEGQRSDSTEVPLPGLRILSPFDPLIRDRKRLRWLFGFDYRIEVFVPAAKRKYGYYVFPILDGERFVGRIDMKHRRQEDNALYVTAVWPEASVKFGTGRRRALEAALDRARRLCGADTVRFADHYLREPVQ